MAQVKLLRVKEYVVVTTRSGRLVIGPEPVMTYSGESVVRTSDVYEVWVDEVSHGVVYRKSSWWYVARCSSLIGTSAFVALSQQQGSRDLAVATLQNL